jgi:hypothetical protein
LRDIPEHEGFVSVTPQGIAKLVNRAEFMKKEKSQQLKEQTVDGPSVSWSFLRANPPTLGHQMVVDQVARNAAGGDYWIFFSHSQDSKKNPLDWETKLAFARQIFQDHKDHLVDIGHIRTPSDAANWLYQQGYRQLNLIVGEDRVAGMTELMNSWNSQAVRLKDQREPVQITVSSAGERDPDAEGISGISGTRARAAVSAGNMEDFVASTGLEGAVARELFDAVAAGMSKRSGKKQ